MTNAPDAGNGPTDRRRIRIELRRGAVALWGGIRPTLVLAGVGQPTQWGLGTWVIPADEPVTIGVYLFARGWRFGAAEIVVDPADSGVIAYRAPWLPFGPGRFSVRPG